MYFASLTAFAVLTGGALAQTITSPAASTTATEPVAVCALACPTGSTLVTAQCSCTATGTPVVSTSTSVFIPCFIGDCDDPNDPACACRFSTTGTGRPTRTASGPGSSGVSTTKHNALPTYSGAAVHGHGGAAGAVMAAAAAGAAIAAAVV